MENNKSLPLKLSKPAHRAFAHAGITTLKQLTKFSEQEISELHGVGPKSIIEIKQAFKEKGLAFSSKNKTN